MLTAYYRTSLAGNSKPRPPWFSRRAALTAFLVSAERAGADVVVVADGGVPPELVDLVPGEVVRVQGGSTARSWRRFLDVVDRTAPADGLLWFAEDDYAYLPEALTAVRDAAQALPAVDYLGVYTPDNAAWHARSPSQPAQRPREQAWDVGGRRWERAWASTSTFGVRARAFREDRVLLRLCSRAGGPWDHACVLSVQGVAPYPAAALHRDLFLRWSRASAGRALTRPLLRAAVDLQARGRRRTWAAPAQALATHVEPGHLAPGRDWGAVLQP